LDNVLEGTELQVARRQNVNPLRFWALVECVNCKNGHSVTHKKGAYANGGTVYTPSAIAAGATNEEALA
jgi:phosphatidylethanolamine/phosphatidyl-N-methylethanolamine N-methyltransferase